MKNLLCVMKYYLDTNEGPAFPKFDHQMASLKRMGFDVYFLGILKNTIYLVHAEEKIKLVSFALKKIPIVNKLVLFNALYRAIITLVKRKLKFSYVYMRTMPAVPPYRKALSLLKESGSSIIVEIPTYPPEYSHQKFGRFGYNTFFKISNKYETSGSQYVDLYALNGKYSDSYNDRPAINFTNGIDADACPVREYKPIDDHIHVLGIGKIRKAHGYDRFINGLVEYYHLSGNPSRKVVFHVVGYDADGTLPKLQDLVRINNLDQYVLFEGAKFGKDLEPYFSTCAVALAPLAISRTGFTTLSALKTKEFISRGIPFIIAGDDPNLPRDKNWFLQLGDDETPINIENMIHFIDTTIGDKTIVQEMHRYAGLHLSWDMQFEKIFTTLDELIDSTRKGESV